MDFRVLGPLEVVREGRELELGPPQQRKVLAMLAMHNGTVVSTDALLDGVWGEAPPSSARQALHLYISRLRRALDGPDDSGRHLLATRRPGYVLTVEDDRIDAQRFEQGLLQAQSESDPRVRHDLVTNALDLWRGPAYADFTYDEFAASEIRRLGELKLQALELQIAAGLDLDRHNEVLGRLAELIPAHPLREGFRRLHMLALYRSGRQAEALQAFQEARRRLADELGIEPGEELSHLEEQILLHDPGLELGNHGPGRNLPTPAGSFVGRAAALESVGTLIEQQRIVTISGPPGVGKTRLAIEVASLLADRFDAGVRLIELENLSDGALVAPAVASVVGVSDLDERDLIDRLIRHIQGRRLLLLLDNCEHVIDAVADLVARLTPRAPALHVVATSRQVLRVAGEFNYPLPPMPVPGNRAPPAQRDTFDAVRLFVDRAVAADPGFELNDVTEPDVVRICSALDGLPLAIELAAARVRALSTAAIADGLAHRFVLLGAGNRGSPAHHRTLEDAVAWSYELAEPDERRLFRKLAVFVGGFTAEDAVAMLDEAAGVMDTLTALVDKSLVAVTTQADGRLRYRLLETLQAFAWKRLDAEGATSETQGRHAAHFQSLADRADHAMGGPDQIRWIHRLAAEQGNFRAALEWTSDHDRPLGLRLAVCLGRFWIRHGDWTEGRRWLTRLIEEVADGPLDLLGGAHQLAGSLALQQNDAAAASHHLPIALSQLRRAGELDRAADTINSLGVLAIERGEVAEAGRLFEEALQMNQRGGMAMRLEGGSNPMTLNINLGWVALESGDRAGAGERFETARAAAESTGDIDMAAWSHLGLGVVAWLDGDPGTASGYFDDAVDAWEQLEAKPNLVYGHVGQALIYRDRGEIAPAADRAAAALDCAADLGGGERYAFSIGIVISVLAAAQRYPEVARLMAALLALAEQHSWPIWSWYRAHLDQCLEEARAALGTGPVADAEESGSSMTIGDALRYATEQVRPLVSAG